LESHRCRRGLRHLLARHPVRIYLFICRTSARHQFVWFNRCCLRGNC
jgi:hypothetical protein